MFDLYRLKDRILQWWHYPQPSHQQRKLLGQYTDSFDLDFTSRRLASESSAQYMTDHMRQAVNFKTDYDLHQWVIDQLDPQLTEKGLVLEFGVATGRTINHWARLLPEKTIYGFDSFEGLPEDWTWYMRAGHFRQRLPRVRSNVKLEIGWFDETLEDFLDWYQEPIAFLHIDSDLYSSASYVLENLSSRLRPGSIVLFDEYLNFPGWQNDEFRAWRETVQRHRISYEYIGFVSRHQQVAVRITKTT